ncbi:ATP-binding protein [Mariprofundus ferrooxydans]|uniref:hybrid sensor histidine kinase/response regulator n=1 Tax=Mariprofundus ferrooxydans TaxID=314344 RepID=UPI000376C9AF|nr:ATP-binding protein [Mariprofundus ferrooxydans]
MTSMRRLLVGYRPLDEHPQADRDSMIQLIGISIPIAAIFTVVNAIAGFEQLAIIQLTAVIILAIYWYQTRRGQMLSYIHEVLMLLCISVFASLTWAGGIGSVGIYWSLGFPFLAFLIMGVRSGWIWLGAYALLIAVSVVMHAMGLIHLPYSRDTLVLAPVMYLYFTLLACVLQVRNEKQYVMMEQLNRQLKESQQELSEVNARLENDIRERVSQLQATNSRLSEEVVEKEKALTAMRNSEKKFEHAQRMEAVGTLVGGIAHDFNNMLSGITANLYLMQRDVHSEQAQQRLAKIGDLVVHAADMIKQLLTFARRDSVELSQFDLRSFLGEAYKLARVSIEEHIHCEQHMGHKALYINGNATQIQQMLMNLMNNARDAVTTVSSPMIRVTLSDFQGDASFVNTHPQAELRSYALLTVADNGVGIQADMLPRIFEPFYTTKQAGKGTGLGLAMIYGAMRTHHGVIDVTSQPGEGTSFSLYFPLAHEEESDVTTAMPPDQVVQGHDEMILLVDDDRALLEAHEALLTQLGYRVMTAVNGIEAIRLYREHGDGIALVLMDVVMPVLGGVAAAKRIMALNKEARIIFVSGYDRDHDITSELMPEHQLMLNKPLDVIELSRAIAAGISGE